MAYQYLLKLSTKINKPLTCRFEASLPPGGKDEVPEKAAGLLGMWYGESAVLSTLGNRRPLGTLNVYV